MSDLFSRYSYLYDNKTIDELAGHDRKAEKVEEEKKGPRKTVAEGHEFGTSSYGVYDNPTSEFDVASLAKLCEDIDKTTIR